jgi:hypothetical protein
MTVLFFSGYPGMPYDVHQRLYSKVPGRLLSMHPIYVNGSGRWLWRSQDFDTSDMELMVDSGAFTAWNKEDPAIDVHPLLDLYRWVDRLAGNRFKAVWFISLDVIPGVPGREPTHDEIKDAVYRSDENHEALRQVFGNRVIPVFHQGEHPDRLLEVMEINPIYIGISPQNQIFEERRWRWARNVHELLKGEKIMTHGLATTGGTMMETIDWRSVDSTTWVLQAAMGKIRFEWEGQLIDLGISEGSSGDYKLGKHWDTVTDDDMLNCVHEICDKLDITTHMLRARDTYRSLFNAHTMMEWSKRMHAGDKLVFKGV